jgi:hypothetical protein
MARVKEVNYFSLHPERSAGWYRAHFPLRVPNRHRVSGEASPYYMYHPYVPARLARMYPSTKLIVLLREPSARAVSHYVAMASGNREPLSLGDAILREMEGPATPDQIIKAGGPRLAQSTHRQNSYVGRGLYAEQLDRWLEHFPRSAMFIGKSEDLFDEPKVFMDEVADFLGISPLPSSVRYEVYNPGYELPASRAVEDLAVAVEALRETYRKPNEELFERYGISWEDVSRGASPGE